jgi:hypothetical protein
MAQDTLAQISEGTDRVPAIPKMISPGAHAVLDYGVVSTYFALWAKMRGEHDAAATLACINGTMVLAASLMTNYPGGVFRTMSFKAHRTMDWIQAATAAFGPVLMGFAGDPEAAPFYTQALSEVGVIAATDWDAVPQV